MEEHKPYHKPFTITRQEETPDYNQPGSGHTVWTVHFRTASGVDSSVTVPSSGYNAENVAKLISEKSARIEEVHAMHAYH